MSKSELKRLCVMRPMDMSARIHELEQQLTAERAAHEETKRKLEKAETKNTAALNLKIELCEVLDTEFVSATDKDLLSYAREFRRRALTAEAKLAERDAQIANYTRMCEAGYSEIDHLEAVEELMQLRAQVANSREREPDAYCNGDDLISVQAFDEGIKIRMVPMRSSWYATPVYRQSIIQPSTTELIEQARREENDVCNALRQRVVEQDAIINQYEKHELPVLIEEKLQQVRKEENEACAKVCEIEHPHTFARHVAAAIRARMSK